MERAVLFVRARLLVFKLGCIAIVPALDCGVDVFQFDQPAVYDMPALAAKLRGRKTALWSPTDIQKVLPTGDRDFIVAETRRMLDTFKGCLICKNYPDLRGIGVDPECDRWAYEEMATCRWQWQETAP